MAFEHHLRSVTRMLPVAALTFAVLDQDVADDADTVVMEWKKSSEVV